MLLACRACPRRRCSARCSPTAACITWCRWCAPRCCSAPRNWRRSAQRWLGRRSWRACTSHRWCRRSPALSRSSPGAAAVLRCDAGGRRAARVPRPVPALAVLEVSHLGGSLVGLGLLVLARALFRACRRPITLRCGCCSRACSLRSSRGSISRKRCCSPWCSRAHARPPRLLPPYRDSLGALHAGVGGEHRGVIVMAVWIASSRTGASATPTSCGGPSPCTATRRACCAPRSRWSCWAVPTCCSHAAAGTAEPAVADPRSWRGRAH